LPGNKPAGTVVLDRPLFEAIEASGCKMVVYRGANTSRSGVTRLSNVRPAKPFGCRLLNSAAAALESNGGDRLHFDQESFLTSRSTNLRMIRK